MTTNTTENLRLSRAVWPPLTDNWTTPDQAQWLVDNVLAAGDVPHYFNTIRGIQIEVFFDEGQQSWCVRFPQAADEQVIVSQAMGYEPTTRYPKQFLGWATYILTCQTITKATLPAQGEPAEHDLQKCRTTLKEKLSLLRIFLPELVAARERKAKLADSTATFFALALLNFDLHGE